MIRDAFKRWLGVETRDADPRLSPSGWNRAFPSSALANAGGVESNVATALACVNRQAVVLAGLPLAAYRRLPDGGRERIRDGSLARIIDAPNSWQSRFDFVEGIVRSLHFQGNSYHEVRYGRDGLFESLVPLSPNATIVEQTRSGAVRLRVSEAGGSRTLVDGEYLHVRMPGSAPTDIVGVSTVQRARGALGLTMELNEAASASANRTVGGYIIQAADTNARSKRAKGDEITEQAQGARDRFRPRILDPGAKFIPTTFSNADAELLASRQNAAQDVCLIFGMTPGMFGLLDTSSYGSAAQAAEDFVVTCLGPLANRIEEALGRCLLSDETRQTVFFEFSLDGILRSNPTERFRQYEIGRRVGLFSPNDLRRYENLPPRIDPGGDAYDEPKAQAPETIEPPIASAT